MLGATRWRIAQIHAVEYAVLGMVTAGIAASLGAAIAWAVSTQWMRIDWMAESEIVLGVVGVGAAVALVFGFLGTWRQLSRTTATALRNE
jgi:putative ABC transport system permease protein